MKKYIYILVGILLIISSGMYISIYSIDGDKLHYMEEKEHNTNPFNYDTDNDGLSDSFEVNNGYNPRKKTMLVTVHDDREISPEMKREINKIKEPFAEAPVDNPNGEQGINLHIEYKQIEDLNTYFISIREYEYDIKPNTFDKHGEGYYNILLVYDVCDNGECDDVTGVGYDMYTGSIVQRESPEKTAQTTMHELGHMVGINKILYDGVDSKKYSSTEYNSVMNYNEPDTLTYAIKPFNDWEHIENNLGYTTDTSNVDNQLITTYKNTAYISKVVLRSPYRAGSLLYYKGIDSIYSSGSNIFASMHILLLIILFSIIMKYEQ